MKMEILAALLPNPDVLFLDEPTLGLDIAMQKRIRRFVSEYTVEHGATALLTSHYMADVTAMCERVIVIHHGGILFDGGLKGMADSFAAHKTITVTTEQPLPDLSALGVVVSAEPSKVVLRVDRDRIAAVASELLSRFSVVDLSIEDPPIEDVIEGAFAVGDLELAEDS
jgi:ABC-2 type transport system ATP-binding protein